MWNFKINSCKFSHTWYRHICFKELAEWADEIKKIVWSRLGGEKWDYTCPPSSRFTCCRTKPSRFPAIDWSRGTRSAPRRAPSPRGRRRPHSAVEERSIFWIFPCHPLAIFVTINFNLANAPITVTWSHTCTNVLIIQERTCLKHFRAPVSQSKRGALRRVGARGFLSTTLISAAGSQKFP